MATLACKTKKQIGAATGTPAVRILTPGTEGTSGWAQREPLIVCAQLKSKVMGLVPLPNDRIIRSKVEMSIELDEPAPDAQEYTADAAPAGGDWAWCN
jgi:hypothetical protein